MSVGENIAFPLRARKIPADRRKDMVDAALHLVQLPDMRNRSVGSLSGGQQQRVALARALVFEPTLLLLDEPLAALDKQLREAMQLELKRIQVETGTTTISVTHDQVEAMSMSDLVAIMNQGRLAQVGTPEEVYRQPADLFVATFLGEANLLEVRSGGLAGFGSAATTSRPEGIAVVRPEDIELVPGSAAPGTVEGKVEHSVFQGNRRRLSVRCASLPDPVVVSGSPERGNVGVGDAVGLRLRDEVYVIGTEAAAASQVFAEQDVTT
jgi:putative spermidine/putrescine transport system ATP-binding protein